MPLIINPPFKTTDSGLVLYAPLWAGELSSGISFNSRDINKHLCTVTGALWTPQGRWFDGTDDYITVPRHTAIEPAEFTLEAWVKFDAFTNHHSVLFSKDQTSHISPYYSYHFRTDTGDILFLAWNDGTDYYTLADTGALSTGQWYHLAATFKLGEQRIYRNGVITKEGTRSDTITYYNTNLILGASLNLGGAYDLYGTIGEARIYNRALTALEIQHNRLATKWRYS